MTMKHIYAVIFSLLALATPTFSYTQENGIDTLGIVDVISIRSRLDKTGSRDFKIDSNSLKRFSGGNLADVLSTESPVFIKSYGLGSLATTSFRGGSAAQTAILWNGIPLNNPTNGQLDLALIPTSFFNEAQITFGGGSSLWGSGAIGGSINLTNNRQYNRGFDLNMDVQAGSFHRFGNHGSVHFSNTNYSGYLAYGFSQAKNNFPISSGQISTENSRQKNAELAQHGIYTEHKYRLRQHEVSLSYWGQNTDRNIPASLSEINSRTSQRDEAHKVLMRYQYSGNRTIWQARLAQLYDEIKYLNPNSDIQSTTISNSWIAQAETEVLLGDNHSFILGFSETFSQAVGTNFDDLVNQNRLAGFASYVFRSDNDKLQTVVSTRQEILNSKRVPIVFSGGLDYSATRWLSLRLKASRDYRIPTLNDQYWYPGGNPNLLPESGYSQEGGFVLKKVGTKVYAEFEGCVFNRQIDNWIIWLPNGGFWSPQNLKRAWSRGTETATSIKYTNEKISVSASLLTNYTVSTNESRVSDSDRSLGKQLIYVPIYQGGLRTTIEYQRFTLTWNTNYTGYRYTSSDHSEYLNPFWITDAFVNYHIPIKSISLEIYGRVNNLFNKNYQAIQNRPMPGRHFLLGLNFDFKRQKR